MTLYCHTISLSLELLSHALQVVTVLSCDTACNDQFDYILKHEINVVVSVLFNTRQPESSGDV